MADETDDVVTVTVTRVPRRVLEDARAQAGAIGAAESDATALRLAIMRDFYQRRSVNGGAPIPASFVNVPDVDSVPSPA